MDEKYLHLIWEMKRLPSSELRSVDGKLVEIKSFGIRNDQLAGPDFFYGRMKYDGLEHFGMIEIHVKSSDWYAHKHHFDSRYNNVILHVVYEYDKKVIQNNSEIPTVELKDFIDPVHFRNYKAGKIKTTSILCRKHLGDLPRIYLESMKSKAIVEKLDCKISNTIQHAGSSRKEVLFGLITLAFGTGVNNVGFERIIRENPVSKTFKNGLFQKSEFLSEASSLFNDPHVASEWNVKGVRPYGNPRNRLKQLTNALCTLDLNYLTESDDLLAIRSRLVEYIESIQLSKFMKNQLLINVVTPYLWFLGDELRDERIKEYGIELLQSVSADKNNIIQHWIKQNVPVESAYDSQSLIAVFRYYCSHKNCLSCEVGTKLLKQ